MPPRSHILLISGLLVLTAIGPARAQAPQEVQFEAAYGLREFLRGRRPAVIQVVVTTGASAFEGRIDIRAENSPTRRTIDIRVPGRGKKKFEIPFSPGDPGAIRTDVSLSTRGGGTVHRTVLPGTVSGRLSVFGLVGRNRDFGIRRLLSRSDYRSANQTVTLAPEDIPEKWEGLAPLDVLILDGSAFAVLSTAQTEAVRSWALRGGTLVALGTGNPAAWRGSFVARALGLEIGSLSEHETAPALTRFARISGDNLIADPGRTAWVSTFAHGGSTVVKEGSDHLICRTLMCRGWLFYFAFDPSAPGMRGWRGRDHLWRELLSSWIAKGDPRSGEAYRDESETLLSRMLQQRAVAPPSIWVLVLLIGGYGLLIGPLEYVVLKAMGRRSWTAVTFPLIVTAATVAVVWVTGQVRGSDVILSEVLVEDIDPVSGDAVFENFVSVFSPRTASYTFSPGRPGIIREFLSENRFVSGGRPMPCRFDASGEFDLRLPVGASRTFHRSGVTRNLAVPVGVSVTAVRRHDRDGDPLPLHYDVEVRNGFPFSLEDIVLVSEQHPTVGSSVLRLRGTVGPGETGRFETARGEVLETPLADWLRRLQKQGLPGQMSESEPDVRSVFPFLSFFAPSRVDYDVSRLSRRDLRLRDILLRRHVIFTAWASEPGAMTLSKEGDAKVGLRQHYIRMRLADDIPLIHEWEDR